MRCMFEGKLSSQEPNHVGLWDKTMCSNCYQMMVFPDVTGAVGHVAFSYVGYTYYIYPSKSGKAAVYCSTRCRDLHNHRFHSRRQNK